MKKVFAVTCLIGLATTAVGQNTKSAQKPSSDTTSLEVTLKLIQDKVNEQGEISYTMTSQNTIHGGTVEDQYAVETAHAIADPHSCTLEVGVRMVMNGKTQFQGRAGLHFRDLTAMAVKTQTQAIDEKTTKMGVTGWRGKVDPESYIVQSFQSNSLAGMFFFRKPETANVVAKAMSRAIELCGGKKATF